MPKNIIYNMLQYNNKEINRMKSEIRQCKDGYVKKRLMNDLHNYRVVINYRDPYSGMFMR